MEPVILPYPARLAVFAPILVSLGYLMRLRREGELFGRQGLLFIGWFVAAFVAQLFGGSVGAWLAGLLAQVALAIVLILKQKIDNIY